MASLSHVAWAFYQPCGMQKSLGYTTMLHIKSVTANWRALLSGCAVLLVVAAYPAAGAEQLDSVRSLHNTNADHFIRVQHNPTHSRRTFQGQPEYPPSGYLEEFEAPPASRWPEDRPEFRSDRARDMTQGFVPQRSRSEESDRFLEWSQTRSGSDSRADITPPAFGEHPTASEHFPEPRDPRSLMPGHEHSPHWSRQPSVEEARREPSWPTPPAMLPNTPAHWSQPASRAEVPAPSPPAWGSDTGRDSSSWPSARTMDTRSGSSPPQWPSYSGSQQWPSASDSSRTAPQWRESPEQAAAPRRGAGYEPPPRFASTPYDQGGAAFPPPQWPAPPHSGQGVPPQAERSTSEWPPQRPPRWAQDSYRPDPGATHYPDPRDQRLRSPDWHR